MHRFISRNFRTLATYSDRRPTGVSRREKHRSKKKHQLGFEPLEDRQMLSAESPLAALQGAVTDDIQLNVQSISSATPAGQAAILQNELYWQSLIAPVSQQANYTTNSIPTDPLVANQWFLINSGQEVGNPDFQPIFAIPSEDINVAPAWNLGFTGAGVTVAVIDTGVQIDHPDLNDNISPTLQFDALDLDNDASPRPQPIAEALPGDPRTGLIVRGNAHGTEVAGLIGAEANNGIGGTGVAPGVTLVPIRLIDPAAGLSNPNATVDAFRFATDEIDITNNSWSPAVSRGITGPTPDELLALRDSIISGRDGLGLIHIFSSGNDAGSGFDVGFQSQGLLDSAIYNGWVGSRYTIGVTGVDHDGFYNNADGTVTSYPEAGANVLVAAPTGSVALAAGADTGLGSGIFTTDVTGEEGNNYAPDPNTNQEFDRDFLLDTDYTSRFNGTSASAPIATGVVALMLEANPNLSWRDVQEILVRSARQNGEFDVPSTGNGEGGGSIFGPTQNTWITNQMSMFRDPDIFDGAVDPLIQTLNPTLDPNVGINHFAPTPMVNTNAAGFTVSQGKGVFGEEIGFAHGVVDAELAVQLAQQWDAKNQTLPGELTFTTFPVLPAGTFFRLPASEVGNDDSGQQLVPGGLGGESGFIDYWNEYFATDPFSDANPPENTRGLPISFTVPESNNMTIETMEVKVVIAGGTVDALDYLRILLVSPDGTQSELNDFFVFDTPAGRFGALQNRSPATFSSIGPGSVDTNPGGNLIASFSTNRSWGERSDDSIVFDPTIAEPVVDQFGLAGLTINRSSGTPGTALEQGWQVIFENYSTTELQVQGIEVVFHGSPIGANTQRVQGLIGVDDNRDDLFNFSRVFLNNSDIDGTVRYGEVSNTIDVTHESMGANITVTARRVSDNVIVDQFVTGADGNYYFDLVPDEYIISIDDPLGRTAVDDSITPAGLLQDYQSEWRISTDFFKVWEYDTNLDVPVDGSGTPLAWLDGNGQETVNGMKQINFLLDPGPPPLQQVDFSGMVFADTNGDGLFNPDDVAVPEISVFADENRNGQFDAGELVVNTDINGQYTLTVPSTFSTVMNVGVIPPVDWTATNPASSWQNFFVEPGDTFSNVDFAIMPPAVSAGNGTSQPGYLLGVVFNDANGDARRQESESGVSGLRVYIDANNTGVIDAGDTVTTTNVHGGFVFANVPAGDHIIRLEAIAPNVQTLPLGNAPLLETLSGAGTISGLTFGVQNTDVIVANPSTLDYGDLPDRYGVTTLFQDGARHVVGAFFLGQLIDTEEDGQPSDSATLDDITNLADEDGIVFDPIQAGGSGRMLVTASRNGGYLSGWMDFNGDDDFDDVIDGVAERLVLTKVGGGLPETRTLLVPGVNEITFDLPVTIDASTVFARFRYGEIESVDTLTGPAQIGEVEDYAIAVTPPAPLVTSNGADLDTDGDIDGFDFLAWQRGFGTASGAAPSDGDVTGDGTVDGDDLTEIVADMGTTATQTASLLVESSDFDTDGDADGFDFLTWQRGLGTASGASPSAGDANGDGAVDLADLAVWQDAQLMVASSSAQTASAVSHAEPYLVSNLLGSQSTAKASSSNILNPGTFRASTDNDSDNNGAEEVAGSYPGDIRIVHHRNEEGQRSDKGQGRNSEAREAIRDLTPPSNLLQLMADRAPQQRRLDLSHLAQSIQTRWDRSIQANQLGNGSAEHTPSRDLALANLYGAERRFGRSRAKHAALAQLATEDSPIEVAHRQDAWLAALDAEIDWRL